MPLQQALRDESDAADYTGRCISTNPIHLYSWAVNSSSKHISKRLEACTEASLRDTQALTATGVSGL